MEETKKSKRPRIGSIGQSIPGTEGGDQDTRYEKVNYPGIDRRGEYDSSSERPAPRYSRPNGYGQNQTGSNGYGQHTQGYQRQNYHQRNNSYQQRNNNFGNTGYQSRQQSGYGQRQQRDYQSSDYQNRQNGEHQTSSDFQPRQNNYNRNNQGGYQPRQNNYGQPRQGSYNNQNRMGGYGQPRQGGYNNQNRQNGYGQPRTGGYNNQNRMGGYGQTRPGGYNNQNRNGKGGFRQQNNPAMRFTPRPKQVDYVLDDIDPNEEIRLNKYMANAGICSRREADEFIQSGKVKVNGEVVTELGTKISRSDVVEFGEKVVTPERKCYVLLNKPKDCVTTSDDPNGRTTVLDIVKNACQERIYPVGRLDRNTTGVLLLTNDGDLASKLTHPKFVKKKIYHVWTDKDIAEEDMQRIADGIELEDGEIHADAISYVSDTDRNQAGIEIHSGRNRIVRRIFEHLGYRVTKLDRVYFAGLTKKNLPRGRWRYLTQEEVNYLRMGAFE